MPQSNHDTHIYDYLFPVLWRCISKALKYCADNHNNQNHEFNFSSKLTESNPFLIECFSELHNASPKPDAHIIEGLQETQQKRHGVYPRVLRLTLQSFKEAQKIKTRGEKFVIPSPLHIIYYLFIVPEKSFTAAYSVSSVRRFLFFFYQLHPNLNTLNNHQNKANQLRSFDEEMVRSAIKDLNNFFKQSGRWPKKTPVSGKMEKKKIQADEIKSLVGHFLSAKGVLHLWFESKKTAKLFLDFDDKKQFNSQILDKLYSARFRVADKFKDLPPTEEIINQLFGYPIPVKGAEILFYSGLKPSSNGGLVVNLNGKAGTGKTSLALSMANSFSPFGTLCYYISLEEGVDDIKKRLYSLRPEIQTDLSYYPAIDDWFFGYKHSSQVSAVEFTDEMMNLSQELDELQNQPSSIPLKLPSVCRYIIVIDNINEILLDIENDQDGYHKLEEFVHACRKLHAIVIFISAEEANKNSKLDYLVDIGIRLEHRDIDNADAKPVRLFHLYKTRHQLARHGAHIFHMKGPEGFRLAPQIPSQIDRKEYIEKKLYDSSRLIHMLNFLCDNKEKSRIDAFSKIKNRTEGKEDLFSKYKRDIFLKVYPRTHILMHGYGSAGKAGFALKFLLTPPVPSLFEPGNKRKWTIDNIPNINYGHLKYRQKILVISFLYPEKYYEDLIDKKKHLHKKITETYNGLPEPLREYLVLYPGYLSPQDFLTKVTRKLDEAELEGQPFTGVLVDGLHNVFLQFEKLQDSNMVWPLLYNILSRYDLTVVSTFTNFSLNDKLIDSDLSNRNMMLNQSVPDHLLLQKGMAPFLHALVKAADYYFFMEETSMQDGTTKYLLKVKGAIDQEIPDEFLEWNREENVFEEIFTLSEIIGKKGVELNT